MDASIDLRLHAGKWHKKNKKKKKKTSWVYGYMEKQQQPNENKEMTKQRQIPSVQSKDGECQMMEKGVLKLKERRAETLGSGRTRIIMGGGKQLSAM